MPEPNESHDSDQRKSDWSGGNVSLSYNPSGSGIVCLNGNIINLYIKHMVKLINSYLGGVTIRSMYVIDVVGLDNGLNDVINMH
jgi:hypothetical protein